jgi:hypothetical protein
MRCVRSHRCWYLQNSWKDGLICITVMIVHWGGATLATRARDTIPLYVPACLIALLSTNEVLNSASLLCHQILFPSDQFKYYPSTQSSCYAVLRQTFRKNFFLSPYLTATPAPFVSGDECGGCGSDSSPPHTPSAAKAKYERSSTPHVHATAMASWLIKHRNNFNFHFNISAPSYTVVSSLRPKMLGSVTAAMCDCKCRLTCPLACPLHVQLQLILRCYLFIVNCYTFRNNWPSSCIKVVVLKDSAVLLEMLLCWYGAVDVHVFSLSAIYNRLYYSPIQGSYLYLFCLCTHYFAGFSACWFYSTPCVAILNTFQSASTLLAGRPSKIFIVGVSMKLNVLLPRVQGMLCAAIWYLCLVLH